MIKSYQLNEVGPASNLKLTDIDKPEHKDDEVLIEVKAISINPVDFKVRSNADALKAILQKDTLPVILGWDVAGIVVSRGSNVTDLDAGDRVFGMIQFPGEGKAYAEYVTSPASHVSKLPDNVSFEEGAAATLAALTAYQMLKPRVTTGDKVLIHAGSGGVGHFALQIAKLLGAKTVVATSSAKNKDFCMANGADEHVDYRTTKFEDVVSDVDVVLDTIGEETLERSLRVLKDGGKLISLIPVQSFPEPVQKYADEHKIDLAFELVSSNGESMKSIAVMLGAGQLKVHVSKTFPFSELPQAHEYLESGRTVGKVVVTL